MNSHTKMVMLTAVYMNASVDIITGYCSTLYIGIAMVFVFSSYIRNSLLAFGLKSIQLIMILQHRTHQM